MKALNPNTSRGALEPPKVARAGAGATTRVQLPAVEAGAGKTLVEALRLRRSTRDYSSAPLKSGELAQLLWAAQGVTSPGGLRTAPSAGAIYPLRGYVLVFRVEGVAAGFYGRDVDTGELLLMSKGDKQTRVAKACADQQCVEQCAAALLLTMWDKRIVREFGEAGRTLAAIEAGHIGQNWHLQAAALGLGSISIGKCDAAAMKLLLPIPSDEEPMYLLLAGRMDG